MGPELNFAVNAAATLAVYLIVIAASMEQL
jgi:hypothetical protein